jgi:glycosyltransferase involved in cell wall biosynthesis
MEKLCLSIIIPCLNEEYFLPHLLKNLTSQTFKNFEVIVVDGNSEDKTVQVAQKFNKKYPLKVLTTKTRGVSYQRNFGAKKAKSDILLFFDADTQIPPNYLKEVIQAFQNKRADFLTTYIQIDSQKFSERIFVLLTHTIFVIGKIFKSTNSYGAMQMVKKKAFFKVNGYDTKTKYGEDSQLFEKLYQQGYKYIILKNPRYFFSMRRFRNQGIFKVITQQFKIYTSLLKHGYHHDKLAKKYQMGGKGYVSK